MRWLRPDGTPVMPDASPYRPANGSEGCDFEAVFCDRCTKNDEDTERYCPILTNAYCYGVDEDEYPSEWVWCEGYPICTAYDPMPGEQPCPVSLTPAH